MRASHDPGGPPPPPPVDGAVAAAIRRVGAIVGGLELDCACRARVDEALARFAALEEARARRERILAARSELARIEGLVGLLAELHEIGAAEPDTSVFTELERLFLDVSEAATRAAAGMREAQTTPTRQTRTRTVSDPEKPPPPLSPSPGPGDRPRPAGAPQRPAPTPSPGPDEGRPSVEPQAPPDDQRDPRGARAGDAEPASPPCLAHEVDPLYMGLEPRRVEEEEGDVEEGRALSPSRS